MNRERDRQRLAEILDLKYAEEARRRKVVRTLIVLVLATGGYYAARGAKFVADNTRPVELARKAPNADILAQVKKQISDGDPMLIGQAENRGSEPRKSRGERETFEAGKVPINLYPDLNRARAGARAGYAPASGGRPTLEELSARRMRHPPVNYGMYRPATAADLPKLPGKAPNGPPALYARLPGPPPALAADEREFTQKK